MLRWARLGASVGALSKRESTREQHECHECDKHAERDEQPAVTRAVTQAKLTLAPVFRGLTVVLGSFEKPAPTAALRWLITVANLAGELPLRVIVDGRSRPSHSR